MAAGVVHFEIHANDLERARCTIQVPDIDSTLRQATDAGAAVQMPKDRIPGVGWLCCLKDTEGNIFGVLQPEG
jgi:predicted enzyme related to lactoylglutathione lyase